IGKMWAFLDFGVDCSLTPGVDYSINPGVDCSLNLGVDCSLTPGADCSLNPGVACSLNPGLDCSLNPGVHGSLDSGVDCSLNPGVDCSLKPGVDSSLHPGVDYSINPGVDCSLTPGVACSLNPGYLQYTAACVSSPQPRTVLLSTFGKQNFSTCLYFSTCWRRDDGHCRDHAGSVRFGPDDEWRLEPLTQHVCVGSISLNQHPGHCKECHKNKSNHSLSAW
uniref:Uncharacterized protein n=1 Tax=Cynoglossus semilaevis TaxID=244447 RepID=A0A3P8WNM6_CYNSE